MVSSPLVSVVIPAYNEAETISRAIDSALAQTVDEIEVIVVDDGSDDRTSAVVDRYDAESIRLVRHPENEGVSSARNTGIEYARGEYVAFLDADDVWDERKIEKQLAYLSEKSEEWVGCYCEMEPNLSRKPIQFRVFKRFLDAICGGKTETVEGDEALIRSIVSMEKSVGVGSTLVVETDVARDLGGFDERFVRMEDWAFMVRVLERGKVAHLNEALVQRYLSSPRDPAELRDSKELFFDEFDATIRRLEADGHRVREIHRFHVSRHYVRDGQFRAGAAAFSGLPDDLGSNFLLLVYDCLRGASVLGARYLATLRETVVARGGR